VTRLDDAILTLLRRAAADAAERFDGRPDRGETAAMTIDAAANYAMLGCTPYERL
jgi:hypothetical protein